MNQLRSWSRQAALLFGAPVIVLIVGCNRDGDPEGSRRAADLDGIAAISRLEVRVEEAHRTGDVAFLDSVYAPTFRFVHSTGEIEERAQRLAALSSPEVVPVRRGVDSLNVDVHGDVALSTGRIHVIAEDDDSQWREYTVRYARVYALRGGRWRLLTHHSTGLSFGPPN